jgi:uncharacterized membrane protein
MSSNIKENKSKSINKLAKTGFVITTIAMAMFFLTGSLDIAKASANPCSGISSTAGNGGSGGSGGNGNTGAGNDGNGGNGGNGGDSSVSVECAFENVAIIEP